MNNYHAQIHELKTLPTHFTLIQRGDKLFELRKDDRGYKKDDLLILREWTPEDGYVSCRVICAVITCVVKGEWLKEGYVALGIKVLG